MGCASLKKRGLTNGLLNLCTHRGQLVTDAARVGRPPGRETLQQLFRTGILCGLERGESVIMGSNRAGKSAIAVHHVERVAVESVVALADADGGVSPRDAALGLVAKFSAHVLMSNSCPETNEFAARMLGRVVTRRNTYSNGTSDSVNVGMNAGENESVNTSSNFGWSGSSSSGNSSHGHNSGSSRGSGSGNSWGENRGRGTSQSVSDGYSESMEFAIEPGDFGRVLRTGGRRNGNEVTAVWYQSGRVFSSGTNWVLARFRQ